MMGERRRVKWTKVILDGSPRRCASAVSSGMSPKSRRVAYGLYGMPEYGRRWKARWYRRARTVSSMAARTKAIWRGVGEAIAVVVAHDTGNVLVDKECEIRCE